MFRNAVTRMLIWDFTNTAFYKESADGDNFPENNAKKSTAGDKNFSDKNFGVCGKSAIGMGVLEELE